MALKAIQDAPETRGEAIARINKEMREELQNVDAQANPEAAFDIWMKHYCAAKIAICRVSRIGKIQHPHATNAATVY